MTSLDLKPILGLKNQHFSNLQLDYPEENLKLFITGDIYYNVDTQVDGIVIPTKVMLNINSIEAKDINNNYISNPILLNNLKKEIIKTTKILKNA